ncbi:hypothetical protein [Candidatus Nitrosotalea sp. FS]
MRSEDDWAVTYVLDSAASDLLLQSKFMIPKAYQDVLGFPSYNGSMKSTL